MTQSISLLWQSICAQPRAEFLVNPKERRTYRDLAKRIQTNCAAFDAAGLSAGDRLTIALSDEFEASAVFLAALLDGLVPALLSPHAFEERRASIYRSLDAALEIDDTKPLSMPETNGLLERWWSNNSNGRAPRLPDLPDDHLAYVLFTSGTTATPRGVMVTHQNLFSQLATLKRLFSLSTGSRIFNGTPLSHTDGLVQGPLLTAAAGATLLRPGPFEVATLEPYLDFLRSEAATHMIANPTLLAIITRMAPETDYFDQSCFQAIVSTGGALSLDLWEAVEMAFGVRVWNVYGMTESVADALYAGDHPEMGARGTIGLPIDCDARIAGGGENGELELSGANISPGYWRNEARTRETQSADGWFRTGDIVRRTADGSFEYLGRIKTAINQGAVTIHPEEIDEALLAHPTVLEVATVGLPSADFEEIAVAAVVANEPIDPSALHAHCARRLEPLKRPKDIVLFGSIPKTASGKTDRTSLASLLMQQTAISEPVSATEGTAATVIATAADVFGVFPGALTLESSTETVPGWDSFNHLKLIMAVERQTGVSLSTKDIISIRDLAGLSEKLEASSL